jgi:hypothetical protein
MKGPGYKALCCFVAFLSVFVLGFQITDSYCADNNACVNCMCYCGDPGCAVYRCDSGNVTFTTCLYTHNVDSRCGAGGVNPKDPKCTGCFRTQCNNGNRDCCVCNSVGSTSDQTIWLACITP